jgi:hypothetical protein
MEELNMDILTDEEGRFEVTNMPGTHRLRALFMGTFSNSATVQPGDTDVVFRLSTLGEISGVVHGMPDGTAWARCGDDMWNELEYDGSIHISCVLGSTLEVATAAETHHYAVNVVPDQTSYFELSW